MAICAFRSGTGQSWKVFLVHFWSHLLCTWCSHYSNQGEKSFINLKLWREVASIGRQHCFEQKVLAEVPFFSVHYAILISAAICIEKAHLHLSLVFSHPSPGATFVTFYPRYLPRSSLRTVVAPSKHSVAIAALSELRDVIVPKVTETLQRQTL